MDASLIRFLQRPVMIILGTVNTAMRPEIGRAVGVVTHPDTNSLALVVSRWQWPATVANVEATGRMAATFSRPSDYETYQIKGRAMARAATAADVDASRAYCRDTLAALMELGVGPDLVAHWQGERDLVAVALSVDAVFVQTPGPRAGQRMGGRA